ncbi:hypothetical protein MATL_G00110450 [Megalops atlanticus]|uniref:Immunoglobulin V-set domain-containing protein n=1 Tax=Megalops atlanticus TaxID=7932 RepID=A0A9D3Q2A1_MEGAT|nr:hypothetical protein MATL_G00110450 [Megalops atlanticus]
MELLILALLLLLDGPSSRGQQRIDTSGRIFLQFNFDPNYSNYEKYCCKFHQEQCLFVVTSTGYVSDVFKGRISIAEYYGSMEIWIWNLQVWDSGIYRCVVQGPGIFTDFRVKISDSINHKSPPLPPRRSTVTSPTTVKINTMATTAATSVPVLTQYQSEATLRVSGGMWITLAAVLSILILVLITSVTTVLVHLKKKKKNKSGTAPCDGPNHFLPDSSTQDVSGIVYTTVDFKPRENPAELYANLRVPRSPAASSPETSPEPDYAVEYAALAVRP